MRIKFENEADARLNAMLDHAELLAEGFDVSALKMLPGIRHSIVHRPTEEYSFLHEAAIIAYRGVLFASWYNCPKWELKGHTPIRGRRSADGGGTWSEVELLAEDPSDRLMYCPPVYGICDDSLYLLMNTMVAPDHMHSLELYRYDETDGKFHFLRSMPVPFKLNTNVCRLNSGKLLLPGRIAEPDGFPNTPAVMISDSGRIDAAWRLVGIREDGNLPDGSKLVHPELSAVIRGDDITIFCRDDERNVPLIYRSADSGEHWSAPVTHDIPFSNSKIYSGVLSDGRAYVVGNLQPGRSRLGIFFTEPGGGVFTHGGLLRDGYDKELDLYPQFSYPAAVEDSGTLYVIYTMQTKPDSETRGAMLTAIDLKRTR